MRIDNRRLRVALAVLAAVALLAAACGSSDDESAPEVTAPASDATETVRIGNEIGNRLPNFELTLTSNGEKLTSTELVESGRPAFLFFFATT